MDVTQTKRKAPAGEPKPRGRPQKNPIEARIETPIKPEIMGEEKVAMSITKIASKIYKPASYDEAVNDPFHGRRWKKAIEEELQNLESHQTWKYKELPPRQKAIGLK